MKTIPAVPRWLIIRRIGRMMKNPIPIFNEYLKKYGDTYMVYMAGMYRSIISSNPDFVQHVLQKNNRNYQKSPIQSDTLKAYVGLGLLTSNGDYWLRQRRLIQPGFHRQKLQSLVQTMQAVVDETCQQFETIADTGKGVEMNKTGMEIAFKIVAKSLFGSQLPEEKMLKLANSVTTLQEFIIRLIRIPFAQKWYQWTGEIKAHKELAAESSQILMELIQERRASGVEADDLLDMLLKARYEDNGEGMTDQQLRDESLILFLAGHETTANAIAWLFYLLSEHPKIVETLREEISSILGKEKPNFEHFRQMEFTTAVINEAMRLYPPAWITDRIALEDDMVNGYPIKKGDIIVAFIYGLHHSKDLWENPETFNPYRFLKEKKERHSYAFLPFGGGPRLCIGNSFAMMEMQMILIHLIRQYDFELVENQKIETEPLVTLRPKNGIYLRVKRRIE